jgi:hypothetical protein
VGHPRPALPHRVLHRVAPGVIAKELMEAFRATGAIVGFLSAAYF